MQKHPPEDTKKPTPVQQPNTDTVNKNKQKSEQAEVAGRHKNDGRNDHEGHKVSK